MTHGHWIRLLRATGFVIDDLVEVRRILQLCLASTWSLPNGHGASQSEEIWIAHKA